MRRTALVLSTLHVHLDLHHCLEIMTLKGMGEDVRALADKLRSAKGILQSALSLTSLERMDESDASHNHHHAHH